MADIFDVAMSTVCDASVMCQTLSEYGDGSMGNGILKYGNEMLVIGEKVGYEQGVKDTFQVAFKEGFDEGYSQGFSQGNLEGIIKGCAITVGVGVVIWGTVQLCKKMKEKRKADGGNENKEDIYENTDVHATAN